MAATIFVIVAAQILAYIIVRVVDSYNTTKHAGLYVCVVVCLCLCGADFDSSVHTLLNCINVYHELDESHRSILNILGELLDCKSESSYIDCLNPDDIDCMVYCILTQ